MQLDLQTLILLVTFLGSAFAIYKDWQRDKREKEQSELEKEQAQSEEKKQSRADLQADYDRVKGERDALLIRVKALEEVLHFTK